jgi:hypothetical protein
MCTFPKFEMLINNSSFIIPEYLQKKKIKKSNAYLNEIVCNNNNDIYQLVALSHILRSNITIFGDDTKNDTYIFSEFHENIPIFLYKTDLQRNKTTFNLYLKQKYETNLPENNENILQTSNIILIKNKDNICHKEVLDYNKITNKLNVDVTLTN